jgi:hypothetical protein
MRRALALDCFGPRARMPDAVAGDAATHREQPIQKIPYFALEVRGQ